jgi:hypothetical protein
MAKVKNAPPKPPPALPTGTLYGNASVQAAATLERFQPAGPSLPHTVGLVVIRARGGFIVFQAGGGDEDDPANAIGVAATPMALALLIDDWGNKAPPPEFPA